jgi:hypothetical protein
MKIPKNISKEAQLIKGLNGSSWFTIIKEKDLYRIERFSEEGVLECSRLFKAEPNIFDIKITYEFTYISHCKECTVIQNKIKFKFYTDEY